MRNLLTSLILAAQLLIPSAMADGNSSLFIKELNNLSDGIIAPRADVPLTTYNTEYAQTVSAQQDQLETIYRKIYGLDAIDSKDFQAKAEAVYLLENEIALFLQNIPTKKISSFERNSLLYRGIQAYKSLRTSAEQTYDNTLRLIDIALPGPGGPQIRVDAKKRFALYLPNYRSDVPLSDAEKKAFYDSKLSGFITDGGSLDEIKLLTGDDVLRDSKNLSTFEYVQLENGEVRFTAGSAGHLLLAAGSMVRAAGNIATVRDVDGKILLLVVSNSSGTFKPDIFSAEQTARTISRILKTPSNRVVVTRGEPFGLQNVKILLKADGLPKVKIEERLQSLRQKVSQGQSTFINLKCEKVFKVIK